MKKSIRWSRFFESLIYFILLTIPMISVFSKVIYVQSNPNAYNSYSISGVSSSVPVNSLTSINDGDIITFKYNYDSSLTATQTNKIGFSELSFNPVNYGWSDLPYNYISFSFANNLNYIYLFVDDTFYSKSNIWGNTLNQIVIKYNGLGASNFVGQTIYTHAYSTIYTYNSLDNTFEIALNKVIQDYGTGNINFLNWFDSMFFNNANNLLYINFVNMYLNYALWVSVGYLIYYFLTFFVKIIRNLVDGFIKKGESW